MFKKSAFLLFAAAYFLVPWIWAPARDWAPGLAVLSGILFSVLWGNPFASYTSRITSNLLGATIVGMGFGMNLTEVLLAGGSGFLYTLAGIVLGLSLGMGLGRLLGVSRNAAWLVSVGTSICGGSAIAAAAPVLKAKSHDIALASATVFLLNAVALWVFPAVGSALGFTQEQFGYWAALGIHDTSSVVGASMAYGEEALAVGTTVKLARALWIVPVTIFLSCFASEKTEAEGRRFRVRIPWFIPCFIAASALVTFLPGIFPAAADFTGTCGAFIRNVSKYLMITTLFLIGANLSRSKLKELGMRPVIMGTILWLILASLWCTVIYLTKP